MCGGCGVCVLAGGRVCVYKALGSRGVIFLKQRPQESLLQTGMLDLSGAARTDWLAQGDTERPGETVGEHLK